MSGTEHLHHIPLLIAGFAVSLATEDPELAQRLRRRYGDFVSDVETARIALKLKTKPGALYIQPEPGPWVIESSYRDSRLVFRSYQECGEVDLAGGHGFLEMAPEAHVENFLRAIFAWLCLQSDGLLLHAAGVIRDGRGYVFFGPSGAGKTTTSVLASRTSDVVSDDLVIIRCDGQGCTLHGVPFKGELSDAQRANQSAPLKGLFRLRQDTEHFTKAVPLPIAVADLAASAPFVVRESHLSEKLLSVCQQVAATVPVKELHFRRDDGFWRVIDGHSETVSDTASSNGRQGH